VKNKTRPSRQQTIGRWGERLAEQLLLQQGYTILARNARTPYGELDLVARCPQGIVFVEVKTRTSSAFGLPENAITPRKRVHLLESAQHYLLEHPELDGDWRVDVIAIQGKPSDPQPQIEWFENALG
jgi:putative endonuclease